MKSIFYPITLLIIMLCGCQDKHVDKRLIEIEKQIHDSRYDQALSELENTVVADTLDDYNKAYYYILLSEVKDKKEQKLFQLDSVVNYALKVLMNSNDDRLFARALISKGKIWEELEAPQEAVKCYHKALDLSRENDFNLLTSAYACLGNIYSDQRLIDDALDAFKSGYNKTLADTNMNNKYTNARNLGMVYLFKQKRDSAYVYFMEAFNYASYLPDSVSLKDVLYNDVALYHSEQGENEEALSYMNKIITLTDVFTLNKGLIYASLEEYDSAKVYLNNAVNSDGLGIRTIALVEMAEMEEKRGNFQKALSYMNDFLASYDSLSEKTFSAEIYGLNQLHNIQTEITKVRNRHNTRIIILISCSVLCILVVAFAFIMINRKKKAMLSQERLAHEIKIAEKEKELSDLHKLIAETRNRILELKYETVNATGEIQEKEKHLANLHQQLNNLRMHLLKDKLIYKKIQRLDNQKKSDNIDVLASKDREELSQIVKVIYADFYLELNTRCPSLSEEDCLFCCLAKMNFSLPLISACTGYPRTASARQRKHRIKKKMVEESDNMQLYTSIFGS